MKDLSAFNLSSAQPLVARGEPQKVKVTANGQTKEILLPCTLVEFLESQKLRPQNVVVEYNGRALAHSEFARIQLAEGDRLEIVRVIAGGLL